jgi:hypothetical protein
MKQSTRTSSRKGQKKRIYNCTIWKSRKQNSEMRKSRSRGNVERNFTRASALGEILLRPGESEIVWEIFIQCAKILSLRTGALSSLEKQCHDPPLYGKILGCQREGKIRKQVKSGGKTSAKVGCSAAATDVLPACTKGQRRPRHEEAPKYSFSHRERWEAGWGSMGRHCKIHFLHYESRSSLNPNRAILLVQALKNSPTSFT